MYGNGDWEAIQACHEQSMCEAMDEVLAEREKEERSVKGRSALLLAKGLVERTDPAHPQSPKQKYRLVLTTMSILLCQRSPTLATLCTGQARQ